MHRSLCYGSQVSERASRELGDPGSLKALGHPLRQQILQSLRRSGPATATTLAAELGENTGATSYHLRQLAAYGFVDDVPERTRGRERWWRARPQDIRFAPRSEMSEEARLAFDTMTELNAAEDEKALAGFIRQRDELGPWGDALLFSRSALRLDPQELRSFWEDYLALVLRYQPDEPGVDESSGDEELQPGGPEARRILVRFLAFPDVG